MGGGSSLGAGSAARPRRCLSRTGVLRLPGASSPSALHAAAAASVPRRRVPGAPRGPRPEQPRGRASAGPGTRRRRWLPGPPLGHAPALSHRRTPSSAPPGSRGAARLPRRPDARAPQPGRASQSAATPTVPSAAAAAATRPRANPRAARRPREQAPGPADSHGPRTTIPRAWGARPRQARTHRHLLQPGTRAPPRARAPAAPCAPAGPRRREGDAHGPHRQRTGPREARSGAPEGSVSPACAPAGLMAPASRRGPAARSAPCSAGASSPSAAARSCPLVPHGIFKAERGTEGEPARRAGLGHRTCLGGCGTHKPRAILDPSRRELDQGCTGGQPPVTETAAGQGRTRGRSSLRRAGSPRRGCTAGLGDHELGCRRTLHRRRPQTPAFRSCQARKAVLEAREGPSAALLGGSALGLGLGMRTHGAPRGPEAVAATGSELARPLGDRDAPSLEQAHKA